MIPKQHPKKTSEEKVFFVLFYLFALLVLHVITTRWFMMDITNNNIFGLITGAVGYVLGQKLNSP